MSKYRETLHTWAKQHVPREAEVVEVKIAYDDGYDPTFTDRPASISVSIAYREAGHVFWTAEDAEILTSVGELLTALFKIEESA